MATGEDAIRELEREFGGEIETKPSPRKSPARQRKPKGVPNLPANIAELIEGWYNDGADLGMFLGVLKVEDAEAIKATSPKIGAAWARVCETSALWAKTWTRLTTAGKYGELVTLHVLLVMGILNRRGGGDLIGRLLRPPGQEWQERPSPNGDGEEQFPVPGDLPPVDFPPPEV